MMVTSQKSSVFLLFLIHATYLFCNAEADVISECILNHTTCSETYGDVYNTLASQRNYFNIALALYPSREPSAVLVHVNLYAFNRTEISSPTLFTWSMSCLYAAIPARVLEVLSLWSIIVTYRSRELHVSIFPFCCNVSENERYTIIQRALSELQDLAKGPTLQDPTLNTAECITKGHTADISTLTGSRQYYLVILLLSGSFGFASTFGSWTSRHVLIFLDEVARENDRGEKLAKAFEVTIYFSLLVEFGLQITVISLLALENSIFLRYIWGFLVWLFITAGSSSFMLRGMAENSEFRLWKIFLISLCGILTAFHFFWVAIGIMRNISWGLLVLLVISAVIFVIFRMVYFFISSQSKSQPSKFHFVTLCLVILISTPLALFNVATPGLLFFVGGSENDVFKTALIYLATALFTWIYSKNQEKKRRQEERNSFAKSTQTELQDIHNCETYV